MSDLFYKSYKFCPVCGNQYENNDFHDDETVFTCKKCGYKFFQNLIAVTSSVTPLVGNPYKILLATRNIDPMKGKLDIPGGIPKFNEFPEETIVREMKEELGIEIKIKQVCSIGINDYDYKGKIFKHSVTYFLTEPVRAEDVKIDGIENSNFGFYDLREFDNFKANIGFTSDFQAIKDYLKILSKPE